MLYLATNFKINGSQNAKPCELPIHDNITSEKHG